MKLLTTAHVLPVDRRRKFEQSFVLATSKVYPTSTYAYEVRVLTFEVSDNFGSNDVRPCGAYGSRLLLVRIYKVLSVWKESLQLVFKVANKGLHSLSLTASLA